MPAKPDRIVALELAVQTVHSVPNFSNFQVVQLAKLYEEYITDGTVPPVATVPEPETEAPQTFQEGDDAQL